MSVRKGSPLSERTSIPLSSSDNKRVAFLILIQSRAPKPLKQEEVFTFYLYL